MIHNLPTTGFTNLGWNQHPSPVNGGAGQTQFRTRGWGDQEQGPDSELDTIMWK